MKKLLLLLLSISSLFSVLRGMENLYEDQENLSLEGNEDNKFTDDKRITLKTQFLKGY